MKATFLIPDGASDASQVHAALAEIAEGSPDVGRSIKATLIGRQEAPARLVTLVGRSKRGDSKIRKLLRASYAIAPFRVGSMGCI